ncbi:MAG: thermonuclease family protein, partial [Desulfobulbus sp.]
MKRLFLANLFFVFPLIGLLLPSTSFSWSGPVLSISDGDTIIVLHEGKREKIRLYGIDCPEKDQVGGEEARKLTLALISGRRIEVEAKGKDRYGRTVGLVKIDSTSLNESLILNGYAWVYWQYCDEKFCSTWLQLEGEARKQKKGMWKNPDAIPPWEWKEDRGHAFAQDTLEKNLPHGGVVANKDVKPSTGNDFICDGRIYCSQMTSCEEAKF